MSRARTIEYRFDESKVLSDIYRLMETMSELRFKSINSKQLVEDDMQEYLKLANYLSRLLGSIESEHAKAHIHSLVEAMNENEALLHYDPLQRGYWELHNPEFVGTLDSVLIQLYGDNFDSLDKAHHLMSAIKFTCAKHEESEEERERIAASILPVVGRVRGENSVDDYFRQFLAGHEGSPTDLRANLEFTLGSRFDQIRKSLQAARDLGYLQFTVEVPRDEYVALSKEFPDIVPQSTRGRGSNQYIKATFTVNKAPAESESACVPDKLRSLLENEEILMFTDQHASQQFGDFCMNFDYERLRETLLSKYKAKFPQVKINDLELPETLTGIVDILQRIIIEMQSYPDIFGLMIGDEVEINELVAQSSDENEACEEYLWTGSKGRIEARCEYLSIEFHQPRIKGQMRKSRNNITGEMEPKYCTVTTPSDTKFPHWYKKPKFAIGDTIQLNDEYGNLELKKGDLTAGNIGRVVGYTYKIKFTRIVDREGNVSTEEKTDVDIHQYCLTRTSRNGKAEKTLNNIVSTAVESMIKTSTGLKFDVYNNDSTTTYVHHEAIGSYDKCTMLIRSGQLNYVLCYITEKKDESATKLQKAVRSVKDLFGGSSESEISDQEIALAVSEYKGLSQDAFQIVGDNLQPIYMSLAEFKDGTQINWFEVRR